jgi:hypothetical protein
MILVVSHQEDDHTQGVLRALGWAGHDAVLLDTAAFPRQARITQHLGSSVPRYEFATNGHRIDLRSCKVAWWRRPQPFTLHDGIDPGVASFTYTECHEAISGLWAALPLTWVNPPALDETAHHKPYQLVTATKVGLPVPRTLITNDPDEARTFITEVSRERVIYKTFLATEAHWRETRIMRKEDLDLLDSLRLAPVIFQEYVPAVADIRVTVVGERLFAAAIRPAPGGYAVDYRMDMAGATFEPTILPAEVEAKIRALMDHLGLVYGAIDLRRTPEDEHVFLEVNPAGEWVFVEERTGQPITNAMADLLITLDEPAVRSRAI